MTEMCGSSFCPEIYFKKTCSFNVAYPLNPYENTLESCKNALRKKESYIAVTEIEDRIIGFCKVDIKGEIGILDYLVVKEKFRGKVFGTE